MTFNQWYTKQIQQYLGTEIFVQGIGTRSRIQKYRNELEPHVDAQYTAGSRDWWAQRGSRRDLIAILGLRIKLPEKKSSWNDQALIDLADVVLNELTQQEAQTREERKRRWLSRHTENVLQS